MPVDRGELGQQRLQQPDVAEVLAVGGVVLGDQHDLLDALLGQPAGLVEHVGGRREMKEPRKDGMAQKEQRRSQPEASFTEATGAPSSRRRRGARGPEAGARPSGEVRRRRRRGPGSADVPGSARDSWRSAGLIGSSLRRSRGVWEAWMPPVRMVLQAVGDVGVVVEAEHAVRLGQRLGEFLAVPLGHAARRRRRPGFGRGP